MKLIDNLSFTIKMSSPVKEQFVSCITLTLIQFGERAASFVLKKTSMGWNESHGSMKVMRMILARTGRPSGSRRYPAGECQSPAASLMELASLKRSPSQSELSGVTGIFEIV